nr:methyltransferase domain-containing protein [Desulfobacterales bacterium]
MSNSYKVSFKIPQEWEEALTYFCQEQLEIYPYIEDLPEGTSMTLVCKGAEAVPTVLTRLRRFWRDLNRIWNVNIPFSAKVVEIDLEKLLDWRRFFTVIHVTPHLAIKPYWEEYSASPGETVIAISPKNAFGTGLSPTTRICLELMEETIKPGLRVLDVGTGSGILAIYAEKLGAQIVDAIDNDPSVFENLRENISLNGCTRIRQFNSDVRHFETRKPYHVAVSNLILHEIKQVIPSILKLIESNGTWIVSGILAEQKREFINLIQDYNCKIIKYAQKEEWWGAVTTQGEKSNG